MEERMDGKKELPQRQKKKTRNGSPSFNWWSLSGVTLEDGIWHIQVRCEWNEGRQLSNMPPALGYIPSPVATALWKIAPFHYTLVFLGRDHADLPIIPLTGKSCRRQGQRTCIPEQTAKATTTGATKKAVKSIRPIFPWILALRSGFRLVCNEQL